MPQGSMQLLEIRLDALEKDVGTVNKVVSDARSRTVSIRDLTTRLTSESPAEGVHEPLRQIRALAKRVGSVLEESSKIRDEINNHDRGLADALSSKLPGYLDQLKDLLTTVRRDIGEIDNDMVSLPEEQVEALESSLQDRCRSLGNKIGELRKAARCSASHPDAHRSLWASYEKMLREDAQPLFEEYVDFIGGVAVRDNALDNRVCHMTDVLLTDLPNIIKYPLSVPARHLGIVMKSVIKLGFPAEWTMWGIPLVGYQEGVSIAENERSFDRLVSQRRFGLSRAQRVSLFADIFATYRLGPAYACAAILLHFEPRQTRRTPSDIDRARSILDVLDRLANTTSGNGITADSYIVTVTRLRELWQGTVDNLGPHDSDPPPAKEKGPLPARERHVDMDGFLQAAWEILSRQFHAFDRARWQASGEWLADLKSNRKRIFVQGPNEAIELLTAAWRARLEDPSDTARIAETASSLWRSANGFVPGIPETVLRPPAGLSRPLDTGLREPRDEPYA